MPDGLNKRAPNPGTMISGSGDGRLTVGDIRDAIHDLDNDVEIIFGSTIAGDSSFSLALSRELKICFRWSSARKNERRRARGESRKAA